MPNFRKKPVVIEARQYTRNGLEAESVASWCGGMQTDEGCIIHTLEGDHLANYGDWIIKGVKGEFYPCNPSRWRKARLRWSKTKHAKILIGHCSILGVCGLEASQKNKPKPSRRC